MKMGEARRCVSIRRSAFVFAIVACCIGSSGAMAQTTALTPGTLTPGNNGATFNFGFAFRANSNISVTNLGAYDSGSNGLAASHVVTIYTIDGTSLGSVTISGGSAATAIGDFQYSSIAPVALTAGSDYVVSASNYQTSVDNYAFSNARTVAPQITYANGRLAVSSGSVFPTSQDNNFTYYGANFLFSTSAAPEPGSWALMILGFGIAGYALRTRKRSISFGNQVARAI